MRHGLWCSVALIMMLLGAAITQAAPLEQIRQILRSEALIPPAESALLALNTDTLASGLKEIDPYARFFKAGDYHMPSLGQGPWEGIGAELSARGGEFFLAVYQGGAAEQAGLPDRAKLLAINGRSIAGLPLDVVAKQLAGEAGSIVTLSIARPDARRTKIQVERRAFTPLAVEAVQSGARQVLRIRQFVGGLTRAALLATIDFLSGNARVQANGREEILVIDLRDSGGGDLFEALDIAGLFLPAGTFLGTLAGREAKGNEFRAPSGTKFTMPLALLVGPDTASAAEVLAGTLQQHGRAKLIGQRTYGKCSSQTDTRLSDGSVLRYTNREALLPDGRSCSNVGLQPELIVPDKVFGELSSLMSIVMKTYFGQ